VQLDGGVDDERAAGAGEGDLAECDHEGNDYSEQGGEAALKAAFLPIIRCPRSTGKNEQNSNFYKGLPRISGMLPTICGSLLESGA
jgi:hypothetical protein